MSLLLNARAACALSLMAGLGTAQSSLSPERITAPVKHRGTYHLATGSWSRANTSDAFNSPVLYNNRASTGYFFGTTGAFTTIDHGRIPSASSPSSPTSVTGLDQLYEVDCFEIAYCSSIPSGSGGVEVVTSFYESYAPCSDIDAPSAPTAIASFLATGLAAGTPASGQGCWIVAFDLAGSGDEFLIEGDGDGDYDSQPNIDSFGWSQTFLNAVMGAGSNDTGPLIAGNCPIGGIGGNPTVPQQGFGTRFGGVAGATDATGLGTNDFFWIDSPLTPAGGNGGCFFFGGCNMPPVTGPGANPFGGFWLELFGTTQTIDTTFCASLPNATGSPAQLTAQMTDPNVDLVLTSTPVPNTTGVFFYGPMALLGGSNLGDGPRCVGGSTTRMLPYVTAGMMAQSANTAQIAVSYSAPYAAGLTGIRHFQHWFRSGLATGTGSNASNGIQITF